MTPGALVRELVRIFDEALSKGLDEETATRAATWTERRIYEAKIRNTDEIRCAFSGFGDGFCTGRRVTTAKLSPIRKCLCSLEFPSEQDIRLHMMAEHRNWPPEQVDAVAAGQACGL